MPLKNRLKWLSGTAGVPPARVRQTRETWVEVNLR